MKQKEQSEHYGNIKLRSESHGTLDIHLFCLFYLPINQALPVLSTPEVSKIFTSESFGQQILCSRA
jgi:hypothetical protein